jgi:hypothetical protein
MNIGGLHFFGGLFYLVSVFVVLSMYLLLVLGFLFVIVFIINQIRTGWRYDAWDATVKLFTLRRIKVVLMLFAALNLIVYLKQREEWMGDDNANFAAKEYYVAGQVLYFYRAVLSDCVYPGKYRIFSPLDWLQEQIYNQGIQYLPKDDGEIGVWTDVWLTYPYSKRLRIPYCHSGSVEVELPIRAAFLDRAWFSLQAMATRPFQDQQMYRQHYLRNFAGMAHYYAYRKYEYVIDGRREYAQKPEYIARDEQLVGWLLELKKKWVKEASVQGFLNRHAKVEVMREVALMMELVDIMVGRIWTGKFDCSDPYFQLYADVRKEFSEDVDNIKPAILRMTNKKEARQFYYVVVNSEIGRFSKYVLKKYCGYEEIAGPADMRLYTGRLGMTPEAFEEWDIRRAVFIPEIKLIEEQINE